MEESGFQDQLLEGTWAGRNLRILVEGLQEC